MCRIFIGLLLLGAAMRCHAQKADTAFVTASIAEAKKLHANRIQSESLLYNGGDYGEYHSLKDEHPFYLSDDWIAGSVMYDGQFFDQLYLQYDIEKDQLVIENYNFGAQVQLIKSKVKSFSLGERRFVHLNEVSMQKGFYEVLYDGPTKVVARRIKQMQERVSSNGITREFEEKNKYYMWFEGKYVPVRNKKSALKVLHAYKKELQLKFQDVKINTKKQPALQISILAELYDSLQK